MVLMAIHLTKKVKYYFIDKCLPFGSSRSCKIFQDFSDALKSMAEYKMIAMAIYQPKLTNYLDDFFYCTMCGKML